jgi:hypothetical protein
MRPRLVRVAHGWEARPVRYRVDPRSHVWDIGRVAAWARPLGARGWPYAALTHLSALRPASDTDRVWPGQPRWRTRWVVADPALLEPIGQHPYTSAFWRDQLSAALGQFAAELGRQGWGSACG